MARWKSHTDVERTFSLRVHGGYVLANPSGAFEADVPTLWQYGQLYGVAAPKTWIQEQLAALFMASASRDPGMADGIRQASDLIASEAADMKLSEMLLFFARYKAGHYDDGYSQFDTRRICIGLQRFKKERAVEYARMERERIQHDEEQRRFTPPKGHTSLSWYKHLRELAADGDAEAIQLLRRPNENENQTIAK